MTKVPVFLLKAFHIVLSLNKVVKEHTLKQNTENVI